MSNNSLDLALRIRTDLKGAKKELEDFGKTVENVGQSGARASSGQDKLGNSAKKLIEDIRAYEDTLSQVALTHEQVANQEERLDRLMAAGVITTKEYDKAVEHLDKSETALSKQHQQQERALQGVLRTADRTTAELKKLENAERVVTGAFQSGRIGATEYDRAMSGIARRRAELEATSGTVARLGLNSRDTRSQLITLGRSLAAGNWSGAGYDILRIGSSVDKTGAAFARLLLPVSAVLTVLGGFAAVTFMAWQEQRQFADMLSLTGNYAGTTRGEYEELSRAVADSTEATIGQSREVVGALLNTGRVSESVVDSYARAIIRMQTLTGRSTKELVDQFVDMEDGVAAWAAEQNKKMHFLTRAQYEQIKAAEERGEVEQAMQIALDAIAEKQIQNAGRIEQAWLDVKAALSDAKRAVLDFVRPADDVLERELARARSQRANLEDDGVLSRLVRGEFFKLSDEDKEKEKEILDARISYFEEMLAWRNKLADEQGEGAQLNEEAIEAQRRLDDMRSRIDREKQMTRELEQLRKDVGTAAAAGYEIPPAEIKRLEDDIRTRHADPETTRRQEAADRYLETLQQQANAAGKTAAELRSLEYEANKPNLSDDQRMQASGALFTLRLAEEKALAEKDAKEMSDLRIQLLRAQGREADAAALEIEERFAEMRERLTKQGDTEGLGVIDQLINLERLQERLDQAGQAIDRTLTEQQRREADVTADREAGLITEADARRRIIGIHQETHAELLKQKPLLEDLAKQPGKMGAAARIALEQLSHQATELLRTVDLFESTLRSGLESGLTDAITGLTNGTLGFKDAVRQLASTVIDSIIRINAEKLAQDITGSVMNSEGGGAFVNTLKGLFGFAQGGQVRGRGTGTSDSNLRFLSHEEMVIQSSKVREPGALDFLSDFNDRGMAALKDWGMKYSPTAGFVPDMPAPTMAKEVMPNTMNMPTAAAGQITPEMTVQVLNLLDPEDIARAVTSSSKFTKAVINTIAKHPKSIKQVVK